jgi:hypothetical protein
LIEKLNHSYNCRNGLNSQSIKSLIYGIRKPFKEIYTSSNINKWSPYIENWKTLFIWHFMSRHCLLIESSRLFDCHCWKLEKYNYVGILKKYDYVEKCWKNRLSGFFLWRSFERKHLMLTSGLSGWILKGSFKCGAKSIKSLLQFLKSWDNIIFEIGFPCIVKPVYNNHPWDLKKVGVWKRGMIEVRFRLVVDESNRPLLTGGRC